MSALTCEIRTWDLNIAELLRLVWEAELDGVLHEVNTDSVGMPCICRNDHTRNARPLEISMLGRCEFVAKKGQPVELAENHVDGETGEVFVLEYVRKKKIGLKKLKGNTFCFVLFCFVLFSFLFFSFYFAFAICLFACFCLFHCLVLLFVFFSFCWFRCVLLRFLFYLVLCFVDLAVSELVC